MIGEMGISGDIQNRMDAYRGNPQALMQRYSQSQELVDLLALQKLKSEKEAAAREMQMQMESAGLPTVAQQREQEVTDLTKKEVAQQAGLGGQMQAAKQQEAMKNLMQTAGAPKAPTGMPTPQPNQAPPARAPGLPGLGAPNMMPQKAMAMGGIVAFAEGGDLDDKERKEREAASMGSVARSSVERLVDPQLTPRLAQDLGLTREDRALRERQIEEQRAYDAQFGDPSRRKSEALARWLLGGAGHATTGGALAGAGRAALNYGTEMEQAMRNRMLQRQGREQEISDIQRGARGKAAELGLGALGKGATVAASVYGSDQDLAKAIASAGSRGGLELADVRILQNMKELMADAKAEMDNALTYSGIKSPEYATAKKKYEDRKATVAKFLSERYPNSAVQMMAGEPPATGGAPNKMRYDEKGNRIQ